jgi:hypothetical protein
MPVSGCCPKSKKIRRGHGVDFYIPPTLAVKQKTLLDALKDLVVKDM